MGWTYTALTEKSEAKLIEITTDDGSLVFVNGTSSSSKTLSVVAEGFTPVSYKWEKKNGDNWTTISGATDSSYTITGVENVGTYRATAYEDANTDYYDIITIASVSDGQGGSSPYLFSVSNENFSISTDNSLKPTSALNYDITITGYHGSALMTPVAPSATLTSGQYKVACSSNLFALQNDNKTLRFTTNTSTPLASANQTFTVTVSYYNDSTSSVQTEEKIITVSASKNGVDGVSPTATVSRSGSTTTITITDKSGTTSETVNDGANGVSVSSVTEYYQRTNSATAPTKPTSSSSLGSWKTTVDNPISTAQYLYNCEIIKFSNNLETVTNPVQIAKYVTNGANGKGIASIQNVYKLTTNTTAPTAPSATDAVWTGSATGSTSAWGTVCPTTTTTNKYLWNVERVTYDSSPATYSVSTVKLISTHGETGATGGNGTDTWTPVLTSVTRSGNKFTKNLNSADWNAQFYSKEGFKRCFISWKPSQTNGYIMVGLNADPSATSWETLDYAIYLQNNGTFDIRESGATVTVSSNSYTTSNVFRVEYDGAYVNYYKDSTVIRSVARTEGTLLYADSTFYTYNAAIQDVSFGGLGAKGSNYWVSGGWVDLSNTSTYNSNTWYPVVGTAIAGNGTQNFKCTVQLNSGTKPAWASHPQGFSCEYEVQDQRSGWGTTPATCIKLIDNFAWTQAVGSVANQSPVSYTQMGNASLPVFYLRGGGKYYLATTYACSWSIKTSTYTASSQSVSPSANTRPTPRGTYIVGSNGARGATYRGTATSAPSSPVNGDYYFNTSTGYIQTYNGSSWVNDTMAVTNFHVLDAINDIISWCASNTSHSMYNTNKGLADSYVDKLLVGTALINKLFAKQITIQHDSSNTGVIQSSNYVADTSGFKMTGEGVAEFNGNTVKINKAKILSKNGALSIGVGNLETFPSYDKTSILIGSYIMNNATAGGTNVFIGYNIASENSSPTDAMGNNLCLGSGFGSIRGGHENIGIGLGVLNANQDGKENIAIGYRAMYNADTPSNLPGNIGIGKAALYNCKGYGNIQLGTNNIAGSNEPAVLTGSYNILFGYNTGYKITSGSSNTIINNTTVPITTGSNNVIIGVSQGGESSNQSGLTLINGAIKHKNGTLYSANSSNSFKKVITEEDILTSKTAINTGALKSLLNVSEIYLRAMDEDSASGTTSRAYSKACSSYITFSNGLKIQWGVIKAGAKRKDMYFPISFSGYNTYTLFLTNRSSNNSGTVTGGWNYTSSINSKTASTANISIPGSNDVFEWIAIGY